MQQDENLIIEDLLEQIKPKRVNGKAKGNRTELHLCKFLSDRFGEEFTRAPGSGAHTSQVKYLPEHAKKTLTGDICVPEGFKWVIECKGGYEDEVNLNNVLDGKIPKVEEWIVQTLKDSNYCGRLPIVFWKRNRKPWLAMVQRERLAGITFDHHIVYGDWMWVSLDDLLSKTERDFWYVKKNN